MNDIRDVAIEGVDLVLYLDDGSQISLDVSPVQLKAFVRATGLQIHDLGNNVLNVTRFSDETIEKNIIPKLPTPVPPSQKRGKNAHRP